MNIDRYAKRDARMREAKIEEAKAILKDVLAEKDDKIAALEKEIEALKGAGKEKEEEHTEEATAPDAPEDTSTASQPEEPTHTTEPAKVQQKPSASGKRSGK